MYDTVHLNGLQKSYTADYGAQPRQSVSEILFEYNEPQLVDRIVESTTRPLTVILCHLGLEFEKCWIATNVPTDRLINRALIEKLKQKLGEESAVAGDIDLIVGECKNGEFCFEELLAFQVKVRRMDDGETLRPFASGKGTKQARFTAHIGFDRTMLLHVFVRKPQPVGAGFAPSWNPIVNAEFGDMMRRSYGSVRERLDRALFGYCWLGWGQAFGREPDETGSLLSDVVTEPPVRPKAEDKDVCTAREMLVKSLIDLLSIERKKENGTLFKPFVVKCTRGS